MAGDDPGPLRRGLESGISGVTFRRLSCFEPFVIYFRGLQMWQGEGASGGDI
jgi:hypothetical protein